VLRARLLGALEVELNGVVIDSPASQLPWAVFAYIALAARPVARAELAARFWPDVLDQSARASLRSALWTLRRSLGEHLLVDGERVGLSDGEDVWVDVWEFERLAGADPEPALELCRGELLEGIEDDWALLARTRHRDRVIELLEHCARACEQDGDLRGAIEFGRRQVDLDPFDEGAHRRLVTRLDEAGDRGVSHAGLGRELGLAPAPPLAQAADGAAEFVGTRHYVICLGSPGLPHAPVADLAPAAALAHPSSPSVSCSSAMQRANARRARSTSRSSRIRVLTNTVNSTTRRPVAIQYVTRTACRSR